MLTLLTVIALAAIVLVFPITVIWLNYVRHREAARAAALAEAKADALVSEEKRTSLHAAPAAKRERRTWRSRLLRSHV